VLRLSLRAEADGRIARATSAEAGVGTCLARVMAGALAEWQGRGGAEVELEVTFIDPSQGKGP
jgi:hypothetical protein